jgi:hypothetical protein
MKIKTMHLWEYECYATNRIVVAPRIDITEEYDAIVRLVRASWGGECPRTFPRSVRFVGCIDVEDSTTKGG